ncbi:MAG TPA: glycosyltransferase [Rudaea sp.]|jgi:tetratricopeptide (TPR) repeat protein
MRVCLSMIVKNEAAVIERCLRSVKPHVHAWAIADTGSDDGTQDIIRRCLADLPGELIERPWIDFATNRNQALDLARNYGDYALIIDADEVLDTDTGFSWGTLGEPGYLLEFVYGPSRFRRTALPRLDAGWHWEGVLHEALVRPLPAEDIPLLAGLRIHVHSDGVRSRLPLVEKFARDAELLKRALDTEPGNTRYAFYLAQSLRDAGQWHEAIAAYERRAAMGGWAEEVYYSRLQAATLRERTGGSYADVAAAYLDAIDHSPLRAEALCDFARYMRQNKRYALARQFAQAASRMPQPHGVQILDSTVYEWRARDELAVACFLLGDRDESARLWRELLADRRLPVTERERVQRNLAVAAAA